MRSEEYMHVHVVSVPCSCNGRAMMFTVPSSCRFCFYSILHLLTRVWHMYSVYSQVRNVQHRFFSCNMMMMFTEYTKQRILFWFSEGRNLPTISRLLCEEGVVASRQGILKFLRCYKESGTIVRRPGSGFTSKVRDEMKKLIDE